MHSESSNTLLEANEKAATLKALQGASSFLPQIRNALDSMQRGDQSPLRVTDRDTDLSGLASLKLGRTINDDQVYARLRLQAACMSLARDFTEFEQGLGVQSKESQIMQCVTSGKCVSIQRLEKNFSKFMARTSTSGKRDADLQRQLDTAVRVGTKLRILDKLGATIGFGQCGLSLVLGFDCARISRLTYSALRHVAPELTADEESMSSFSEFDAEFGHLWASFLERYHIAATNRSRAARAEIAPESRNSDPLSNYQTHPEVVSSALLTDQSLQVSQDKLWWPEVAADARQYGTNGSSKPDVQDKSTVDYLTQLDQRFSIPTTFDFTKVPQALPSAQNVTRKRSQLSLWRDADFDCSTMQRPVKRRRAQYDTLWQGCSPDTQFYAPTRLDGFDCEASGLGDGSVASSLLPHGQYIDNQSAVVYPASIDAYSPVSETSTCTPEVVEDDEDALCTRPTVDEDASIKGDNHDIFVAAFIEQVVGQVMARKRLNGPTEGRQALVII